MYDRTVTCPHCGFQITAKNPAGPMARHTNRCPETAADVARLVGVDPAAIKDGEACWLPTVTAGRAKVAGPQGTVRAHQRAFELHYGRAPHPGMVIMHRCDTQNCVNPSHFREGTQADNIRDMMIKGRSKLNDA